MTADNPEQKAGQPGAAQAGSEQSFTFHDKRRIDPETGEVREAPGAAGTADPAATAVGDGAGATSSGPSVTQANTSADASADATDADAAAADADLPATEADAEIQGEDVSAEAAKYLDDLQRLNAEYAAYRRRTARDQAKAKESGVISLVEALVPVLDEVKLAADNGDVTGPFETHVNKLLEALGKAGVEQYGAVGDEFDPALHEALMQQPSEAVEEPRVFLVMQPGYRVGERVIRAARVGVHLPQE